MGSSPPLAEQKRIVAKVDELMALCDTLEAQQQKAKESNQKINEAALHELLTAQNPEELAERWGLIAKNFGLLYDEPENVKKLRQAILQLAVQGKLVEQDSDDEPAEVLLERIRKEKERLVKEKKIRKGKPLPPIEVDEVPFKAPSSWVWTRWGFISEWITYGFTRPMPHVERGIPIVTAKNVIGGEISFENTHLTPESDFEQLSKKDKPEKGDILITKDGSIGRAAPVTTNDDFCINQSVAVIWLRSCSFSRAFLLNVIHSPLVQQHIWEKAKGAALKHLSITDFARLLLPIPPLAEQKRIVAKVDELMGLCDALEEKLEKSKVQSGRLLEAVVRGVVSG